jgi:predicted amidohydrolase
MKVILVQPRLRLDPGADNLGVIRALLEGARLDVAADDVVLLPESVDLGDPERYRRGIGALARTLGCHVVGGSHREPAGDGRTVNAGLVCDPGGNETGRYEKLRPYAAERQEVSSGAALGELTIAGLNVLVLVCADFWFADLFQRATRVPDLILVPALSVTRKPTPGYSRALWRHFAVCRAYEFGAYVGISDWSHASALPALATSGVGGFADPTTIDPARLFTPVGAGGVTACAVDLPALEAFRRDRIARGFFWREEDRRPPGASPPGPAR